MAQKLSSAAVVIGALRVNNVIKHQTFQAHLGIHFCAAFVIVVICICPCRCILKTVFFSLSFLSVNKINHRLMSPTGVKT